MTIYVLAFLLSSAIVKIGMRSKRYQSGKHWPTAILSMLPLFFLSAFRYYVGTDYGSYLRAFFSISNGRTVEMEWLYVWINRIIYRLGGGYEWVFIITSAIVLVPTFLHIFDYSPYPIMSILLLFGTTYYFAAFNGVRQLMASAILMYSMRYIERRKPIPFAILIIIASGFHQSSLLFSFMYFAKDLKLTPFKALIIAAAIYLFAVPIENLITNVLRYTRYGGYVLEEEGRVFLTRLAIQIAVLLLASFYRDRSDRFRIYYASEFVAACCVAFGGSVGYAQRMLWTFGYSVIILLPMAISEIRRKKDRIIVTTVMLSCYVVYSFITIGKLGLHDAVPYQFIFGHI